MASVQLWIYQLFWRYAMSFESLMAASHRLSVSVEALAALGAELRLRQEGLEGDRRVRALLHDVVNAVDPLLLGGIDADREASVLALIQTIFRQAVDLLENPARAPGWSDRDPIILQSQGQVSRLIVRGIDALAAHRAVLAAREALAADPQSGTGAKIDVGRSLTTVASLLEATGKTSEAMAAYQRSESVLARLTAAGVPAQSALAECAGRCE